ncbi:hypothetical protein LUZ63_005466 [Rhynchospora breviuscula]|uniref:Germin-like protein n=1 Tax=Rhynchospora breviuscula TaxID=2022672 RepID=A0A9Q0CMX3_9POAL|nr:hypothetical protein LUZ63_005466 [Rhynchospora breviuscula]
MALGHIFLPATVLVFFASLALAFDPSPLQDFCVADRNSQVFVNGVACKNRTQVTADDFFFTGLDNPGNTSNKLGSFVNLVNVDKLPGLNTNGMSVARIDYAIGGLNPPHTHPRATETLVVLDGLLYVGFVATDNKLYSKVISKGEVFVFPIGLVHFQFNNGTCPAVAIAAFNSQNPGTVRVANALFGTRPPISDGILAKALSVDTNVTSYIKSQFQ